MNYSVQSAWVIWSFSFYTKRINVAYPRGCTTDQHAFVYTPRPNYAPADHRNKSDNKWHTIPVPVFATIYTRALLSSRKLKTSIMCPYDCKQCTSREQMDHTVLEEHPSTRFPEPYDHLPRCVVIFPRILVTGVYQCHRIILFSFPPRRREDLVLPD